MTGSPITFITSVLICIVWAATGPVFKYSETWQLVINTGTTIVTFLMVFLIQNTQNRDGMAIQTKLDELIRSSKADDEYMGIETLTDRELDILHSKCAGAAKKSQDILAKAQAEKLSREGRQSSPKHSEARQRPTGRKQPASHA